jgi:3-deoxy-alpha-D-manno-octulosonate 8-oxidase
MFRNYRNVGQILYGRGCLAQLDSILEVKRNDISRQMVFLVDDVHKTNDLSNRLPLRDSDRLIWINVDDEPTTNIIDELTADIKANGQEPPAGIVGIGGGSILDISKAVSVMLTNPGSSSDYQGWDLTKHPGIYHAGVPTLSGTGAEVSRTAVLIGPVRKLGINSDHIVFDQIVLDPDLIESVPDEQRFYTGMDCYVHCVESLNGTYLSEFSRAYGEKSMELCLEVFHGERKPILEEKLMMASLYGGLSIAYSQVGVCHALSYGLSYVLKLHHGIGNCVVFDYLEEFYPEDVEEFKKMCDRYKIELPRNITADLPEEQFEKMIQVSLSLDPLWENALGPDWRAVMTPDRVRELYQRM